MSPSYITRRSARSTSRIAVVFNLLKNLNVLKLISAHEKVHSLLVRANMEIGKLDPCHPVFFQRIDELNQAVIDLMKSKWYTDMATSSGIKSFWRMAFSAKNRALSLGQKLLTVLEGGSDEPVAFAPARLHLVGETTYADNVPLVPEINPIVVLQGSDFEMGCQYAQQVIEIFGPAVMGRKAGRSAQFNKDDLACLAKWEQQLERHAPEILEMARGWAAGASEAGLSMSYEDALDIWTGHAPPARKYLGRGELPTQMIPLACSGLAAWGSATSDGRLVAASSGDHDCTHMVTIVAFPETGNNYVYSTFSAIGDVPVVGNCYMMGHPGMNNKGLVYVHHGGAPKMIEPRSEWGYGIRRGASVLHNLRFANSAVEARDLDLSYPIGDAGKDAAGAAGGFYADSSYGFVIESRRDPIIVREAGLMGETDFLYANNSPLHPEASRAGWRAGYQDQWEWDEHAGWYPKPFKPVKVTSSWRTPVNAILSLMYSNSAGRNRFAYRFLNAARGKIDLEYLKSIYRVSGRLPPGDFEQIAAQYEQTGEWGQPAIGHAGNALVNVLMPDDGNEGFFAQCVGPVSRGLAANIPYPHSGPTYNETNAFWQIKLAENPESVLADARALAEKYLFDAEASLSGCEINGAAGERIASLFDAAQQELLAGDKTADNLDQVTGRAWLYATSRAIRAYTRAQVRAQQVTQAVTKPPRPAEIDF